MDVFHGVGDFSKFDVGRPLVFRTPWWRRLWWWIETKVLRRRREYPGTFVITEVIDSTRVEIERSWTCPGCGEVKPWSEGAADDAPELCDDCWANWFKRFEC